MAASRCPEETTAVEHAWPALPENAAPARRAVTGPMGEAGITEPLLGDVALAVSEAVTNAIRHAYVGHDAGEVRVAVTLSPQELEVIVEDDGTGMAPRPDSPGLGLGLPLIASLTDHVETTHLDTGGTRVRMVFERAG